MLASLAWAGTLHLLLTSAIVTAAPVGCGATIWEGGLYGGGQTQVAGSFPIQPGQQVKVTAINLATCSTKLTNPELVQLTAFVVNTDTYDFSAEVTTAGSPVTVTGATPDSGTNLEGTVVAYFSGASAAEYDNVALNTAFIYTVV